MNALSPGFRDKELPRSTAALRLHFVLGGRRSGKSRHAQRLAREQSDTPVYLATSRAWDAEHQARIARHKRERGPEWTTVEETRYIGEPALDGRVVVLDCATLWLANLFVDCDHDPDAAVTAARRELDRALQRRTTWIVVANEVGLGIHPETEIGRKFADAQGALNQYIAARADTVSLLVAGIPTPVKDATDDGRG